MFVKGQKVKVVQAPKGFPFKLGQIVTVRQCDTFENCAHRRRDHTPEGDPKCVTLEEEPGYFSEYRFGALPEDNNDVR